jgi:hypothetical protein
MSKQVRALIMFSGGLDSMLAAKLLQELGVDVLGINFYSAFFGNKNAVNSAKQINLKLISIPVKQDYIEMLKHPKHGYGSGLNPCIDCKIFMLKSAKKLMKKNNADFIATGEVLGERPMSQNSGALDIIELESGLKGKLLRPLSAKLLPETEAEKKHLVNRNKLLDISGRSRKKQIELANIYNIREYPSPGGGCLLCEKEFASRLADLFKNSKKTSMKEIESLRIGRHFRFGKSKIIVGRDKDENDKLLDLSKKLKAAIFECKEVVGPTTLLIGKNREAEEKAAELTAFYSDAEKNGIKQVTVAKIKVNISKIDKEGLIKLRI